MTAAEREELILGLMPQVHIIAAICRGNKPYGLEFEDLVSAGTIGAIQSVDRWDGERNLSTFAATRIEGAIRDEIRKITGRAGRPRVLTAALTDKSLQTYGVECDTFGTVSRAQRSAWLRAEVGKLPERERVICQLAVGGWSQTRIGRTLGLHESRVSQLRKQAIWALRKAA